jgi:IstB-like ATP binding protein
LTLVTNNRLFAEWREVFPNAACVVSLVDRLFDNAEVLAIEGEFYRLKEAQERAEQRARQRRQSQVMSVNRRSKLPRVPVKIARRNIMSKVSNPAPLTIPLKSRPTGRREQAFAIVELLDDLRDR